MLRQLTGLSESDLSAWIKDSLSSESNSFAAGYQGQTLAYIDDNHRLIIKVPHGSGVMRKINVHLLRHENRVYEKLQGFDGIPACYGMVDNQYLVLQLIDGTTMQQQRPSNEEAYFDTMLAYLKKMHDMGVAHFDLKKKTNLLVVEGHTPCFIDLGVAVIRKPGFHPLNHYLYNLARRFDYNAWIRHKYGNRPTNISDEDSRYYNKSSIEIYTWKLKRFYKDKVKVFFRKLKKTIS